MDDKKYSLKEELKNELAEFDVNSKIKKEDLELDQNIDDKYTSSVFSRYKNGITNNKWFKASGIISIIFGILCIVIMAIVALNFAFSTPTGNDKERNTIIICTIVFTIMGLISIIIGAKIYSLAKYNKRQLIDSLGLVCALCVFQFFFSGLIFVVLTIVGYFAGLGEDYGVIYYNKIDKGDSMEKKLHDAKIFYQNDLISEKEYKKLKRDILESKDIDF